MSIEQLSERTQSQRDRLAFIEMRLRFIGEMRRQDLVARFGIQAAAATRDIGMYKGLRPREQGRYEISHVPANIRERDRQITGRDRRNFDTVLRRYERVKAMDGKLPPSRHIEVKGRAKGSSTVTVTRNEIRYGLNQQDKFILAIVIVDGDRHEGPFYVTRPFTQEPDWAVTSINFDLNELLQRSERQ